MSQSFKSHQFKTYSSIKIVLMVLKNHKTVIKPMYMYFHHNHSIHTQKLLKFECHFNIMKMMDMNMTKFNKYLKTTDTSI